MSLSEIEIYQGSRYLGLEDPQGVNPDEASQQEERLRETLAVEPADFLQKNMVF